MLGKLVLLNNIFDLMLYLSIISYGESVTYIVGSDDLTD